VVNLKEKRNKKKSGEREMIVAEGLNVLIDWQDRFATNERIYKIYFDEIDDVKILINDMKKATRNATKFSNNIVAIFVTLNMGFGKKEIDYMRFNLDLNDLSVNKIYFEGQILLKENSDEQLPVTERKKFESIYESVNYIFNDFQDLLKRILKEQKKTKK
jgi:hypothetical protein